MINLKELRIGNWLNYTLFGKRQIESGADIDIAFEAAGEPISLTPEILEKCGFYPVPYNGICSRLHPWISLEEKGNYFAFSISNGIDEGGMTLYNDVSLLYLHQLQNLYFALTGEDLEIKL